MALWGVRAGRDGEQQDFAIDHSVVVIGWSELPDLSGIASREALKELMSSCYPSEKLGTINNWTGQVWALLSRIAVGDLVALPLKRRSAIALGRVTGRYTYLSDAPPGAQHARPVKWIRTDIPRTLFDQDILYSFGSAMTVFEVSRNDAESRIKALIQSGFASTNLKSKEDEATPQTESLEENADVERISADRIARFITDEFREHKFAALIAGILSAQGYKVYPSSPGADGGIDILAGKGPLGFDPPRLAVQVKSANSPLDAKPLRELLGVMPTFGADQGLLVSWGGFKETVRREARQKWFQIRLWDADDVVAALQDGYLNLPEALQAELPFKRIWTLVQDEPPG